MGNDRDHFGELMAAPDAAEVERMFPLPSLNVQDLAPLEAFKVYMDYAHTAMGQTYTFRLRRALERERAIASVRTLPNGAHVYGFITTEQRKANTLAESKAVADRFAPLLPAIRAYVSQRSQDPMILNRLAWIADEVDAIIEEASGRTPIPTSLGEEAVGLRRTSKWPIPKEWSALRDGLRAMIANLGTANDATVLPIASTGQSAVVPITWRGSVQQLAWMLRELAENGWIGAPTHKGNTTKWKAGDINASAFAKAMAPHFDGVNLGTLERELKAEGGTVPAQDVEG